MRSVRRVTWTLSCGLWLLALPASAQSLEPPAGTLSRAVYDLFYEPGLSVLRDSTALPDLGRVVALRGGTPGDDGATLTGGILEQLGAVPVATGAAGFAFTFDAALGTYMRLTDTFGSPVADLPLTIGRRRISAGMNYQRLSYSHWNGRSLESGLSVLASSSAEFERGTRSVTTGGTTTLDVTTNRLAAFAVFGVTDRLDATVIVPFSQTEISGATNTTSCAPACNAQTLPRVVRSASNAGLNDMFLRGKYAALRSSRTAMAVAVEVRLPTGDPDDFQGTGAVETKPYLIAGYSFGRLSSHLNVGYTFAKRGSTSFARQAFATYMASGHDLNYTAGVLYPAGWRLTISADVTGRRLVGAGEARRIGVHQISIVPGGKLALPGNTLLTVAAVVNVSNSGLKSRVSPILGLEIVF